MTRELAMTTPTGSSRRARVSRRLLPMVGALAYLFGSCASAPSPSEVTAANNGIVRRADLEIVDCLLPGQVRQLGNTSYLTPRRPTHTTAGDCRIRGGEYVAYDRADLKSALGVWMPAAQAGDPEAQTNVADIYERGLGVAPNYELAAMWYQKAADENYTRAIFDLGSLYEQGLGVPQDKLKALNLYRQAWGLPKDSVIYQSAANAEQEALRTELQEQLAEKDKQLKLLQLQLTTLQKQLAGQAGRGAETTQEIADLKQWIARLEAERKTSDEKLAALPRLRGPITSAPAPTSDPTAVIRFAAGMNFGRYYALIIGNQHYRLIDSLQTPLNDAARVGKVLREKYGFTVQILEDSDDVGMLKALIDLQGVLKPDDNLLIYYAGHGARQHTSFVQVGYWLPINAYAPPSDLYWIQNEQITAHIALLAAKRILVVADSCYAGLLSTDPSYLFARGDSGYSKEYIAYKLPKRSRLLISSGGDDPVLDNGGDVDSVFAHAFISALEANQGVLSTPELFADLLKRVATAQNKFVQTPQFKSINGAGNEFGDFFFVPKDLKF